MKKARVVLLFVALVFILISCNNNKGDNSSSKVSSSSKENSSSSSSSSLNNDSSTESSSSDLISSEETLSSSNSNIIYKPRTTVSTLVAKNGRTTVEYLDNPYLIYGVQIRLDNLRADGINDINKWEELFKKTRELNFQTIECQVVWTCVELEKDFFDFFELSLILKWCNKYDLNLQIIWFGSNVAGGGIRGVPTYVANDRLTYPRLAAHPEIFVDYSNPNFQAREVNAMEQMMKFLEENDTQYRVCMIQVEAEPDNVTGVDFSWQDPALVDKEMWGGGQALASITMMDKVGQAVKNSNRKVVTRAAFIDQSYFNVAQRNKNYIKKTFDTLGIDLVGIDNYDATLSSHTLLKDYVNSIIPSGNIAYTPEAGGDAGNTINQAMHAFSRGEGHLIYELRTGNFMPIDLDTGIYRRTPTWDWVERDGTLDVPVYPRVAYGNMKECKTSEVRNFNKMIYKASSKLAVLNKDSMAAFNLENVQTAYSKFSQKCGLYTLDYYSPIGGEAMAMCDTNGDLILLSLYNMSKFTIEGKTIVGKASVGYYTKDGKWVEENTLSANGGTIVVPAISCVRISAENLI